MIHVRQTIRHAAVKALCDANTAAHRRVFAGRSKALQTKDLPAICVYAWRESSEIASSDLAMSRSLFLMVDAYAEEKDGMLDDALDSLSAQIETAMLASSIAPARYVELIETVIELSGDGEKKVGIARHKYKINYGTAPGTAETSN